MNVLPNEATALSRVHTLSQDLRDDERMDWVAVEAPLEVRIDGKATTVLMRTPGEDEELVRGFLFSEGLIARAEDVLSIGRPLNLAETERGNVVNVELATARQTPTLDRLFVSNSSCGVCGKRSLASLAVTAKPAESHWRMRRQVLTALPARLRAAQAAFAKCGGVHASGLFTPAGELVAVREDVGRHNALDKLIGWALANGKMPLAECLLLVSGRVSYEIVQKAIVASLPIIAAVGAPSSLAVELAEQFHLTLVGFLRPDSMNVYANAERITE